MVGVLAEIAALTLCVVSVWCPGSPFDISSNNTQQTDLTTTDTLTGEPQSASDNSPGLKHLYDNSESTPILHPSLKLLNKILYFVISWEHRQNFICLGISNNKSNMCCILAK